MASLGKMIILCVFGTTIIEAIQAFYLFGFKNGQQ
jgi:hypothetical protein